MEFTPRSLTQRCIDLELATPAQIDRLWGELRTEQVTFEELSKFTEKKPEIISLVETRLERKVTTDKSICH